MKNKKIDITGAPDAKGDGYITRGGITLNVSRISKEGRYYKLDINGRSIYVSGTEIEELLRV